MKKMNDVNRLPVTYPGGRYDVWVGRGLLARLRELSETDGPFVIITDSNVGPLYAGKIEGVTAVITIPAGEKHKTLATIRTIYNELLAARIDRQGTIIALGGGVVGDMAGFAAATYLRGIKFLQCPTSLLAMVDASVGGKTGVDLPQGKNLVGAFKQPTAVLADTLTLATLPAEEFSAGMAEIIKHGLIANGDLMKRLQEDRVDDLDGLIHSAVSVKKDVVQADPFEQGRRAVLNLGHTFGHAIEQVSGYAIRHGDGVALGLAAAANLSARLGYATYGLQTLIEELLNKAGLPLRIPAHLPPSELYQAMLIDKKKSAGKLRFVLLRGVGDVFLAADVPTSAVLETMKELQAS